MILSLTLLGLEPIPKRRLAGLKWFHPLNPAGRLRITVNGAGSVVETDNLMPERADYRTDRVDPSVRICVWIKLETASHMVDLPHANNIVFAIHDGVDH